MSDALPSLSLNRWVRAKSATIGLTLLFALVALVAGARILVIEAAVPPALLLDSFRVLNPHLRQRPGISDRNVAYLSALLSDPSFVHARFAACTGEIERAPATMDPESLFPGRNACLDAVNDALAASPGSPLLWLERARFAKLASGTGDEVLRSLRHSYRLGHREGWLMVRRISFLATIWPLLPPDLQTQAYEEMEAVLISWSLRQQLAKIFLRDRVNRNSMITLIESSRDVQAKHRFLEALNTLAFEPGWPLPSAEITVIAGGEAYQGPPTFRLWADDKMVAEVEAKTSIDSSRPEPITAQMINNAMRSYVITVPNIDLVGSIAIEFSNDAWAGEGRRGDRNLWIREVLVRGNPYTPSQLVPEIPNPLEAQVTNGLAVLYANGKFRIDRAAEGWPPQT